MTLTVHEAFEHLKSNLEITPEDEALALRRRGDIFARLEKDLDLEEMVKSGAFHRDTKTKPLKDVDLLAILQPTDANVRIYRQAAPKAVLGAIGASLRKRYSDRVSLGRRSVNVSFGPEGDPILSYDVVPAFRRKEGAFDIPDIRLNTWIGTDPRIHARRATDANKACDGKWKPLVKMLKGWNQQRGDTLGEKPISPSFLVEVIGLSCLVPPIGEYADELQVAFGTLADAVLEDWPDPSGYGPTVNEMIVRERERARAELLEAQRAAQQARLLAQSSVRQALVKWKELFGPLIPVDE